MQNVTLKINLTNQNTFEKKAPKAIKAIDRYIDIGIDI